MNTQRDYTEPGLIKALKEKDPDAYRHLYLNYRGALFSIIHNILPDLPAAEDALQETFVTAWKNFDRYDPLKGRLFTWLLSLARNTAINTLRSKNYKNSLKNEELGNIVHKEDSLATREININQIGLRGEVAKLRPEWKTVLELAYFQGFTHEEIAAGLGIPLGTVKTRLRAAIIELRKQFT